jgi:ATP-dependent DNA helicase RecG
LPKVFQAMAANGSPVPRFEFDEHRTYFQATLPAHPEYGALSALRDAAHLKALGEHAQSRSRVASAWESNKNSAILAAEMINTYAESGELDRAEEILEVFKAQGPEHAVAHVENRLIEAFVQAGRVGRARSLLTGSRPVVVGQDAIDAAILARRARDSRVAHQYFERAGDALYTDSRALHEFAQSKLYLANEAYRQRRRDLNRRFLTEARPLLEGAIQLEAAPARHAWAWRDLARTLNWLRAPLGEVEAAYRKAIELLPYEPRFATELRSMQALRGGPARRRGAGGA